MTMSFGIHIGHMGGPLEEMRRLWKFADSAGFDWFSVSDHFQESPPRGGAIDCFERLTMMTAAAMETRHVADRLARVLHQLPQPRRACRRPDLGRAEIVLPCLRRPPTVVIPRE